MHILNKKIKIDTDSPQALISFSIISFLFTILFISYVAKFDKISELKHIDSI